MVNFRVGFNVTARYPTVDFLPWALGPNATGFYAVLLPLKMEEIQRASRFHLIHPTAPASTTLLREELRSGISMLSPTNFILVYTVGYAYMARKRNVISIRAGSESEACFYGKSRGNGNGRSEIISWKYSEHRAGPYSA